MPNPWSAGSSGVAAGSSEDTAGGGVPDADPGSVEATEHSSASASPTEVDDPGAVQATETSSGTLHPTAIDSRMSPVGSMFLKALALSLSVDGYYRNFQFRTGNGAVSGPIPINSLWISDVYAMKAMFPGPAMLVTADAVVICRTSDLMANCDHFPKAQIERIWVDNGMYKILRSADRHGIATLLLEMVQS